MGNSIARKSQSYIGCALSKYNITAAEQPFFMAIQRRISLLPQLRELLIIPGFLSMFPAIREKLLEILLHVSFLL